MDKYLLFYQTVFNSNGLFNRLLVYFFIYFFVYRSHYVYKRDYKELNCRLLIVFPIELIVRRPIPKTLHRMQSLFYAEYLFLNLYFTNKKKLFSILKDNEIIVFLVSVFILFCTAFL